MSQHFAEPVMEVIKARHSVRTFRPESLSDAVRNELREYAARIQGPFSPSVRIEMIDSGSIAEKADGRIGTYGIIRGARDYAAAVVETGEKDLEQLGFVMEKFILYATSVGLGTCWLGGTFRKSQFARLTGLKKSETLPAVSPVGYANDKRSLTDSFMRLVAGSDRRKPWSELFFEDSFRNPLNNQGAGEYAGALEAVRLAPSASNKQPWRVLLRGSDCHFFMKTDKLHETGLGFNIQRIDMGIGMCHFSMVMEEAGLSGKWEIDDPEVGMEDAEKTAYVVSWKRS